MHFIKNDMEVRYAVNTTASEPRGVYRLERNTPIQKGDLVVIRVPEKMKEYIYGRKWLPEGWFLFKHVAALPGEKYTLSEQGFFIQGEYAGIICEQDGRGLPLPVVRGEFTVPEGHFLPYAAGLPNSFDGRYFGAVPADLIYGKAIPVLIFD